MVTRLASHPFARFEPARLVRVGAVRPGYSPFARLALRLPSRSWRRCFSPTSATDLSTRAPAERSTSGPAASCGDRLRSIRRTEIQPNEPRAASNHLAAIRPQMATHLTARNQLRLHRSQLPWTGNRAPLESGTPVAAGLSPACEVGESTSDTPCRARAATRRPGAVENQNRCYRPLVKMADFPDSECLPSKSALGSPRNEPIENPPPISRLCRRGVGFRRTFATRVLSHRGARPIVVFADSSPASAKGHAPLFDFCNRSAPRTRPPDRPNPAHRAPGRPGAQQLIAGGNVR